MVDIIDEHGRIFGLVNVIDALVVLFVLAVLIAGIALVGSFEEGEPATRYATVDLGTQPSYIATQITVGDTVAFENSQDNLSITDVYRTPGPADSVKVTIRVAVHGREIPQEDQAQPQFEFTNNRLHAGDTLSLTTDEYAVDGTVTAVARTNGGLGVTTTPVVIETTTSRTTADAITEGDTHTINGTPVATVASKYVYPTGNPTTAHLLVGLDLTTHTPSDTPQFGGRPLRIGDPLRFVTSSYNITGDTVTVGSHAPPGEPAQVTVTVQLDNVAPETAQSLQVGMTETQKTNVLARVTAKRIAPATVILESDDGNIYRRDHPTHKDVTLTVDLHTHVTPTGRTFHHRPLQEQTPIILDLETITIQGTVTDIHT